MPDWLVITADRARGGRGVRGHVLAWFLRTYFGRQSVAVQTPAQFRATPPARVDTIFLGFSNSLTPEEIRTIVIPRCRRLVAFDYLDQQELAWSGDQREALAARGDLYLKPWNETAWDHGVRMGLLPLRTDRRFAAVLSLQRARQKLLGRPEFKYDVLFLGRPNQTRVWRNGRVEKLDQRVRWLMELKREAPDLNFYGGLTQLDGEEYAEQASRYGDLSDLRFTQDRVSFLQYCRLLWQSRVLLAPGGNVPWTYRHYECLYAGGVVVTNDFRQRDLLVPLPPGGVIQVGDDQPVLPAVREALEFSRRRPTLGEENFAHLEQYFRGAMYARNRRPTIERFLAQLDA